MTLQEASLIYKKVVDEDFDREMIALKERYLSKIYCNYMFFCIEDSQTGKRRAYSSNPDWQRSFIDYNLINKCALYAATVNFPKESGIDKFMFLWKQIPNQGKAQKEVAGIRAEHGIGNGLSITKVMGGKQFMLGLGTDPKDHELEHKYQIALPTIMTMFKEACYLS
ncbi:hypothetical protein [Candidatus Berkiella aquae]|uniref:Uncharacterized protein n=1 Tax=Candidatus Berkiella aquae TaxID=295108 RepID=A0A0Q9YK95_9GAMM|nr:hypothetical protein [Candidatus Berkiella aquae]MCS5712858.1 hypothetical protein [Candidatus Berkiella aquae]